MMFRNICGFTALTYHFYPVTLAYELVHTGAEEPLLRDEIYCQLIKQTTACEMVTPARINVLEKGLKLWYICLDSFQPSPALCPYVLSHLAAICRSHSPPAVTPNDSTSQNEPSTQSGHQGQLGIFELSLHCLQACFRPPSSKLMSMAAIGKLGENASCFPVHSWPPNFDLDLTAHQLES